MTDSAFQISVSKSEKGILHALLYFDIFDYPLTRHEIRDFSSVLSEGDINATLDSLVERRIIYRFGQHYMIHDKAHLVPRRTSGNLRAEQHMKVARRVSKGISMFPFVRAIMLSGSISKGYMDEKSDIDYFIITKPGRLWVVRTAMAFIRRVFLMNSRKYFCTNYFIDSQHLEISEKNIFTAIEIATLKPMYGEQCIQEFRRANQWTEQLLPNHIPLNGLHPERTRPGKLFFEKMLSAPFMDSFDNWLMRRSITRWKKKYQHSLAAVDFSIAFESTRSVSRSHPGFYQKKVLSLYASKIMEFEKLHFVNLTS